MDTLINTVVMAAVLLVIGMAWAILFYVIDRIVERSWKKSQIRKAKL